jgi:hypothetical protein
MNKGLALFTDRLLTSDMSNVNQTVRSRGRICIIGALACHIFVLFAAAFTSEVFAEVQLNNTASATEVVTGADPATGCFRLQDTSLASLLTRRNFSLKQWLKEKRSFSVRVLRKGTIRRMQILGALTVCSRPKRLLGCARTDRHPTW